MGPTSTRRRFLAAGVAAGVGALAGCTGRSGTAGDADDDAGTDTATTGLGFEAVPTASETLPLPLPREELREAAQSGGPGKDGIPSIDAPTFLAADEDSFLEPGDVVFGLAGDGVAKAYPQRILVWHEIVNDTFDGRPVSVTYCPLTGTAMGFDRGDTTFGVTGRLVNNNLIMYDRASETWWPQMLATSIPGSWNASPPVASVAEFRLVWTSWERWRAVHPETVVLSTATGSARNYHRDPYGAYNPPRGYYRNANLLFAPLNRDSRYIPKAVVLGARTPEGTTAFLLETLSTEGTMTGRLGESRVLAVHDDRFGTGYVYRNPEAAAFERTASGAVRGPDGTHAPDALPLERVYAFDAMWFAWAGYYPETDVHG